MDLSKVKSMISGDPTDSTPVACGDSTSGLLVGKRLKARQGTGIGELTATVGPNLTLENDGNAFIINPLSGGDIERIDTTGWVPGSKIYLYLYRGKTITITNVAANSGTFARIWPAHRYFTADDDGRIVELVLFDIDGAGDYVWIECGDTIHPPL